MYILRFYRKSSAHMFIMKTIDIDVYDENISQISLLLADACVWISKLNKVMLTLCKTQRIVTY